MLRPNTNATLPRSNNYGQPTGIHNYPRHVSFGISREGVDSERGEGRIEIVKRKAKANEKVNTHEVVGPAVGRRPGTEKESSCQVIYSQFGLVIHQNDHQARRRFVEWAQNEIAVVPDFHKRILFTDEAHFWLNGYVNKQNCRIWSEANPQVYVETPLHPEKLTVWCALWAGGILLQKR
ncbi:hypothetical protein TNCV_2541841 [Trichonephila clavipes]|nr:hypothetical protein TNCV_2541841 [Trichonephila clavipes]